MSELPELRALTLHDQWFSRGSPGYEAWNHSCLPHEGAVRSAKSQCNLTRVSRQLSVTNYELACKLTDAVGGFRITGMLFIYRLIPRLSVDFPCGSVQQCSDSSRGATVANHLGAKSVHAKGELRILLGKIDIADSPDMTDSIHPFQSREQFSLRREVTLDEFAGRHVALHDVEPLNVVALCC